MKNNKNGDLLLVIDMQNVYRQNEKWACWQTEQAAQNIVKIIESKKCHVAFTRFIASKKPRGVWQNYNAENADVNGSKFLNEYHPALVPYLAHFPLFTKSTYSSLKNRRLKKLCRKAKRVIISGVVTECCVLATIFELIDEGVYTVFISDAVSGAGESQDLAVQNVLSGLSPLHVKIATTKEYLEEKAENI